MTCPYLRNCTSTWNYTNGEENVTYTHKCKDRASLKNTISEYAISSKIREKSLMLDLKVEKLNTYGNQIFYIWLKNIN